MKLFGKYELDGIVVNDLSLKQVIHLSPIIVPHSFGRHSKKQFGKTKVNVVERLINKLMRGGTGERTSGRVIRTHGRLQGKKLRVIKIVEKAFDLVHKKTGKNPVQMFIKALENASPQEDVTRVSFGGVRYQVATDISATRRLDLALRNISLASLMGAFGKNIPLYKVLAEEIIAAANEDFQSSYALKKRAEMERIAKSAR